MEKCDTVTNGPNLNCHLPNNNFELQSKLGSNFWNAFTKKKKKNVNIYFLIQII